MFGSNFVCNCWNEKFVSKIKFYLWMTNNKYPNRQILFVNIFIFSTITAEWVRNVFILFSFHIKWYYFEIVNVKWLCPRVCVSSGKMMLIGCSLFAVRYAINRNEWYYREKKYFVLREKYGRKIYSEMDYGYQIKASGGQTKCK